jgi:hypothetical protein
VELREAYAAREYALTWGDLGLYELQTEKSQGRLPAEVIVVDWKRADRDNRRSYRFMKD